MAKFGMVLDFFPFAQIQGRNSTAIKHVALTLEERKFFEDNVETGTILKISSGKEKLTIRVGNIQFTPQQVDDNCSSYALLFYVERNNSFN
jgi:hypothetical protein